MAKKRRMNDAFLENVRIGFKNFNGDERQYNPAGQRNFTIFLERDIAEAMAADGWNVKYLKAREEGEEEQPILKVTVQYDKGIPPKIQIRTERNGKWVLTTLNAETVGTLDRARFSQVDVMLNPYQWEFNGKEGVTAYIKSGVFTLDEDELDRKYGEVPDVDHNALYID